jgi:hypothetical protein
MNSVSLIKALLINAACQNATAVCANTAGTEPPIDPLIQDTNLQGKGVMVYEEAKIQYAALLRAFQDQTGVWPDPQLPASAPSPALGGGTALQAIAASATQVLSALPAGTNLASVGGLLQALSALVATSRGTQVAAPGSEIPPTTTPAPAIGGATAKK